MLPVILQCFHPSGKKFISGNARGELREWAMPSLANMMKEEEPIRIEKKNSRLLRKVHGENYIGESAYIPSRRNYSNDTHIRLYPLRKRERPFEIH